MGKSIFRNGAKVSITVGLESRIANPCDHAALLHSTFMLNSETLHGYSPVPLLETTCQSMTWAPNLIANRHASVMYAMHDRYRKNSLIVLSTAIVGHEIIYIEKPRTTLFQDSTNFVTIATLSDVSLFSLAMT